MGNHRALHTADRLVVVEASHCVYQRAGTDSCRCNAPGQGPAGTCPQGPYIQQQYFQLPRSAKQRLVSYGTPVQDIDCSDSNNVLTRWES